MSRHIHLDCVGGISGNMFVGALLACWPQTNEVLQGVLDDAGFSELVKLSVEDKNDGVLTGTYFDVIECRTEEGHAHRHYSQIREILLTSELDEEVKVHALGIFHVLAEAEAEVHGKSVEDVAFHEVGAWDSIADIVLSAWLIAKSGAQAWSVSALPLGSGQVNTAHGLLPVPVPAVALLLKGYRFQSDNIEGERITPTGAAILKHLQVKQTAENRELVLKKTGFGFGSRKFPGISNVLRILVFLHEEKTEIEQQPWQDESVCRLAFEVDDQSAEDLSHALEILRLTEGCLDVLHYAAQGKKGRTSFCVRVAVETTCVDKLIAVCFEQTTTLGIRRETVNRSTLRRLELNVAVEEQNFRVKVVQRPSGELTLKAEMDEISQNKLSYAERESLRQSIEVEAFEQLAAMQESNGSEFDD